MIEASNIHSLTEFQRNARDHIQRLKRTGKPEVLTINGEAEVVVQSAESYQQLAQDAELVRSLRVIRKSLSEAKAGKGRPMRQFLEELAAKHGIQLGDE
jgi:PHD/YefM family antitoxin component YafN of YafNO toxin-antitoxin module